MRRRRRRSRLASRMIGTALLGAALLAQPIATTIHGMLAPSEPAGSEPDRIAAPQGPVETASSAVTDTVGEGDRFGENRLRSTAEECGPLAPEELLTCLDTALSRFQVGPQADDTAALALRLAAEPQGAATE